MVIDRTSMPARSRTFILRHIVRQHAEDAVILHGLRSALTGASHVTLGEVRRFDDRLVAHLDGLSAAGEHGWPFCEAALETPSTGSVFVATAQAIEQRRIDRLDRIVALAEAVPEAGRGLVSAFGWVDQKQLQGIVTTLLGSSGSFQARGRYRRVCRASCEPRAVVERGLRDSPPSVRARVLRTIGEVG